MAAKNGSVTAAIIDKQLSGLHGTTRDKSKALEKQKKLPTPPEISREEADGVIDSLKKTSRFTEELLSYESGSGPVANLGSRVIVYLALTTSNFPPDAMPPTAGLNSLERSSFTLRRRTTKEILEDPWANDSFPEAKDLNIPTPALLKQIKLLGGGAADYIVWGLLGAPAVPLQLTFTDFIQTIKILAYRHCHMVHGGYGLDALVYVILTLEPTLEKKKLFPWATLLQLSDDYGQSVSTWPRHRSAMGVTMGMTESPSRLGKYQ
ncbi:hypothetical protein FRB96_009243 [Tulasnella sp. 330]|nr:hypothetical protein FRB96_009243 [Tulasnella sp. 330]